VHALVAACGKASVTSSTDAENVLKREIADGNVCPGARYVDGAVQCAPSRDGWQCRFSVTEKGYSGVAFVSRDGGAVHTMPIC
jgi:hypothetical protein